MKKLLILMVAILLSLPMAASSYTVMGNQNCGVPGRPGLPGRPGTCSGSWELVLICDNRCNCSWKPMCLGGR